MPFQGKAFLVVFSVLLVLCPAWANAAVTDATQPSSTPNLAEEHPWGDHRLYTALFWEFNSAWEPGVAIGYANRGWAGGKPRLQVGYATTRLYTALGSRTLREDRLRAVAGWHFRPDARVNPSAGLGIGYTRFDREDAAFSLLDNDAFGVLLQGGLEISLWRGLRAHGTLGYEAVSAPTVYPLALSLGITYLFGEVTP